MSDVNRSGTLRRAFGKLFTEIHEQIHISREPIYGTVFTEEQGMIGREVGIQFVRPAQDGDGHGKLVSKCTEFFRRTFLRDVGADSNGVSPDVGRATGRVVTRLAVRLARAEPMPGDLAGVGIQRSSTMFKRSATTTVSSVMVNSG